MDGEAEKTKPLPHLLVAISKSPKAGTKRADLTRQYR
jgi:hypothetical protein